MRARSAPVAATFRVHDTVALAQRVDMFGVPAMRFDDTGAMTPAIVHHWTMPPNDQLRVFFEYARLDERRAVRAWRTPHDDGAVAIVQALPGISMARIANKLVDAGHMPLECAFPLWEEVVELCLPHLALFDEVPTRALRGWGLPSLLSMLSVGLDGRPSLSATPIDAAAPRFEVSAGLRCAPGVRALHNLGLVGWWLCCGDGPRPIASSASTYDAISARDQLRPRAAHELRPELPARLAALLDDLVDPERCLGVGAQLRTELQHCRAALSLPRAPDAAHRPFIVSLVEAQFPDECAAERAYWEDASLVDTTDLDELALGVPYEPLGDVRLILAARQRVAQALLTQT